MSYAILPYSVSIPELEKHIGSKNARLLKKLKRKYARELAEMIDFDDEVSLERALSDLIMGDAYDQDAGYMYGYALKLLCEYYGKMLTNQHWSSIGWDCIEEADDTLEGLGIDQETFRLELLLTRGSPIPLPPITDFPSIGYSRASESQGTVNDLSSLKLNDYADGAVYDAMQELHSWFEFCATKRTDLVCFYH